MSRRLRSLTFTLCLVCLGMASGACNGTSSGYVPVDSPLVVFEPPEKEDLVKEEAPATDTSGADEDDWGGDDDSGDAGGQQ